MSTRYEVEVKTVYRIYQGGQALGASFYGGDTTRMSDRQGQEGTG